MRILRHVITVCLLLTLLLGVPVYATGYPTRAASGIDAVSSATVVLEQPSGAYVVFINKELHTNEKNLAVWKDFFEGREIGFLFEDISCVVAGIDSAGLELAKSFQSRLPENQMSIRQEDITLMLSKLEYGRFDIVFISREVYDAYQLSYTDGMDEIMVIEASGV